MSKLTDHISSVREYALLVEKVRILDPEAAEYMEEDAVELGVHYSGEIDAVFDWADTPQGGDFWYSIFERL